MKSDARDFITEDFIVRAHDLIARRKVLVEMRRTLFGMKDWEQIAFGSTTISKAAATKAIDAEMDLINAGLRNMGVIAA